MRQRYSEVIFHEAAIVKSKVNRVFVEVVVMNPTFLSNIV